MLELISPGMTLLALAGYGIGLYRLRRRGAHWPVTRAAAMLAGSLCAAAAVLPPIANHDELFPVHVAQHLLLGMAAPAFLALSAPVNPGAAHAAAPNPAAAAAQLPRRGPGGRGDPGLPRR
jgi:putative membrane protein